MRDLISLQLRQMLGGRRKWLVALCLILPVLLTLATVGSGLFRGPQPGSLVHNDRPSLEAVAAIYLFLIYAQAASLLLALFYGTSVLGEELDGKTLTYLFTRPVPRWQFVGGKYLGIVIALLPPTLLSLLLSWLVLSAPGGPSFFGAMAIGTGGALLAYNALFVLFGFLIPRRAMVTALLYGMFIELFLSFVPAMVNEFTITYHLRSLVVAMLKVDMPREIARMVGGATPAAAMLVLLCIVGLSLGLAAMLAARREYVVKDSA
jgi:ABC-type transport system involved in multi-copper enzyme maturation permease subunit